MRNWRMIKKSKKPISISSEQIKLRKRNWNDLVESGVKEDFEETDGEELSNYFSSYEQENFKKIKNKTNFVDMMFKEDGYNFKKSILLHRQKEEYEERCRKERILYNKARAQYFY